MQYILASQSPRRKELLARVVENFQAVPADIDERPYPSEQPIDYVQRMATQKAATILKDYPEAVVIGSDTSVVWQNQILGKPQDKNDAKFMLKMLSGQTHEVYTAVSIQSKDKVANFISKAAVTFYPLTEEEIAQYLLDDEYKDKAGAYAVQGLASKFIQSIEGDYYAIVGLPVAALYQNLNQF